ncbi:hypothetical protein B0H10DRAFT_1943405 [Mycena sp. CBHHK59/15]|nr:hypothetical protein B0H10DRAFT_1943405 [Mycena sp. CBHHK59/15]
MDPPIQQPLARYPTCPFMLLCSSPMGALCISLASSAKCIEHKCESCCLEAADSAAKIGAYHDSCKAHNALAVEGHMTNDPSAAASGCSASACSCSACSSSTSAFTTYPAQTCMSSSKSSWSKSHPARQPHSAARGHTLARPMSNTWVNKYQNMLEERKHADDDKVTRQKFDKLLIAHVNWWFIIRQENHQ